MDNRWSTRLISAALLVMAALVILQGIATAQVASAPFSPSAVAHSSDPAVQACGLAADRRSLHAVYTERPVRVFVRDRVDSRSLHAVQIKGDGIWVAQSAKGVVGVDGGVLSLLNCPQFRQAGNR